MLNQHGVPIAPSGYYAARHRPPSARAVRDARVRAQMQRVFHDRDLGRGLYEARKVWAQLCRAGGVEGHPVPRCQVERLMHAAGLRGAVRGRPMVTTRPDSAAARSPDPVGRTFTAAARNRLWVVDFTYVPTWSGMVFTAFVCDVHSRRIVGWRTAARMPTQLPLDALDMTWWTGDRAGHDTAGVIHHSVPAIPRSGTPTGHTAIRYTNRLLDAGAVASIGTVGDSYDNAMAESVIGLCELECVRHDGPLRILDDLELATLRWVHWFNHHRLHSMIGNTPPVEYEDQYHRHNQTAGVTPA